MAISVKFPQDFTASVCCHCCCCYLYFYCVKIHQNTVITVSDAVTNAAGELYTFRVNVVADETTYWVTYWLIQHFSFMFSIFPVHLTVHPLKYCMLQSER